MRLRYMLAFGLIGVAGCATCQPCRAWVVPSSQDDRAPLPPLPPRFATPPEEEQELPPLPVPSPGTGRVRKTTTTETTREVEGASIVVEQHAAGTVVIGSSGMALPAVAQAPQPQMAPVIPLPVPDSLILAAARRVGKAGYVLVTGQCPPPRAQQAYVPVQMVQAQQAPAPVQYVMVPQPAAAQQQFVMPAGPTPTPQAARKHWFGR